MATIKDTAGNIHKTTSLFIDITGKEFGRTRVLALYSKIDSGWKHKYYWLCACSCGTFHVTN